MRPLNSPLLKVNAGVPNYGTGLTTAVNHYFNFFSDKRFCILNVRQTKTLFTIPQILF
jgi:hypothetical protein